MFQQKSSVGTLSRNSIWYFLYRQKQLLYCFTVWTVVPLLMLAHLPESCWTFFSVKRNWQGPAVQKLREESSWIKLCYWESNVCWQYIRCYHSDYITNVCALCFLLTDQTFYEYPVTKEKAKDKWGKIVRDKLNIRCRTCRRKLNSDKENIHTNK